MIITKKELPEVYTLYMNSRDNNTFIYSGNTIRKKGFVKALTIAYLKNDSILTIPDNDILNPFKKENFLINDFNDLLLEDDSANMANTSGMGAIVSAQPGLSPGMVGTSGSGDISKPFNTYNKLAQTTVWGKPSKKRKRKKKRINESLNINNFEDFKKHLSLLSSRIGEKAYDRTHELLNWIISENSNRQNDLIEIEEARPSYGALSNKGIYLELRVDQDRIGVNISTGDENDYITFKEIGKDNVREEKGDFSKIISYLKGLLIRLDS